MPRYVPINDSLSLVEQEIKVNKTVFKKECVNYLWIFDRSGSMHGLLPELTHQLISLSKLLSKGSSLSLGWFSGEGSYSWVFKGFRIVDNTDYKILEQSIKNHSSSLGTTCFSEILNDVDVVINDLSVLSKTFSFSFFTDGYPVVSNYPKEINSIFSAIKKIKGRISTAQFISYGAYYNKQLMVDMAEGLGGAMLIHSSEVKEYTNNIIKLIKLTDNSEPKQEVDPVITSPMATFTVTDQGVVILSADEDGKIYASPQKDKSAYIYYISSEKPNKKSWDKIEVSAINFGEQTDRLSKALYAAALVLTQQTKTDVSLEIVGKVGDKAIVDKLNSAFQVEEYGQAEEAINKAIADVSSRFISGRDPNYLPAPDAFCVFDMLTNLIEDDKAAFFPYHPKFKYERIGVASSSKEGYSKFSADKTSKCPFNTLTWNESRLNLSVQTKIDGTIDLHDVNGKKPADVGFASPYPTYVFRNYSFVKDGHVNIKTFYITSGEETYKSLKNKGIVVDDTFKTDGVYAVDISNLPAINRKIAEGKTSATELCKMVLQEQKLKAQIKSLKWLRDQECGEEFEKPVHLSDEQAVFLKDNGILVERGGVFQPPTEKEDPVDFYMAKSFEIKLSGIATLPTVKKVMEKIASNKGRTAVEALMEEGIKKWEAEKAKLSDKKAKKAWFDKTIEDMQKELKEIRQTVQKQKFAVVLGKCWFEEFSSYSDCKLNVDGVTCLFVLGEEKVPV